MKRTVRRIQMYFMWLVDLVILSIAYMTTYYIRFQTLSFEGNRDIYLTFLMILILVHTLYNFGSSWHADFFRRGYFREFEKELVESGRKK